MQPDSLVTPLAHAVVGTPAGPMAVLGVAAQLWRASNLPNWAVYPLLFAGSALAVLAYGGDLTWRPFLAHTIDYWMVGLGTTLVTSDLSHGTPLQTKH